MMNQETRSDTNAFRTGDYVETDDNTDSLPSLILIINSLFFCHGSNYSVIPWK